MNLAARRIALGASLVSSACVLGYSPARTDAPDAPLSESIPPRPAECGPGCRWSAGYWHWDGGGYVWVPGRWEGRTPNQLVSDSEP